MFFFALFANPRLSNQRKKCLSGLAGSDNLLRLKLNKVIDFMKNKFTVTLCTLFSISKKQRRRKEKLFWVLIKV